MPHSAVDRERDWRHGTGGRFRGVRGTFHSVLPHAASLQLAIDHGSTQPALHRRLYSGVTAAGPCETPSLAVGGATDGRSVDRERSHRLEESPVAADDRSTEPSEPLGEEHGGERIIPVTLLPAYAKVVQGAPSGLSGKETM
jgi:hypothetical protein